MRPSLPRSRRRRTAGAELAIALLIACPASAVAEGGFSLRFFGHGVDDIDRVKIRIDDPALPADPGPPVDVGATDFTIELFMKAAASDNPALPVTCGADNINWIFGNIVLDRDRFDQDRKFGLSIAGGVPVFGVSGDGTGDYTLCGTTGVLDGAWHHVAVQRRRSDGLIQLFVDGSLEDEADGPDGDVSYPDDGVPGDFCGGPCNASDPFVVLGAEKHDAAPIYPSYTGLLDELRVSTSLRYGASYPVPTAPFVADGDTAALYHFDEGPAGSCTGAVLDVSGASGGPSDGACRFGGSAPAGPLYDTDTPFPRGVPVAPPAALWLLAGALLAVGALPLHARARRDS